MLFSFVYVLMAAVFLVQLLLCRRAKRIGVRLTPLVLIVLGEIICAAAYGVSAHMEQAGKDIHGAAFAAVIYAILLLYLLAADTAAWVVSAVVRFVQNRKK